MPLPTEQPFRFCALVPTFNNPVTVGPVAKRLLTWLDGVVVVDDGSDAPGRRAVEELATVPGIRVHRRASNGGKGAAVKDGFRIAYGSGFTHALQVDADGQHELGDVPRLLEAARSDPDCLVLGAPVFDASAPATRIIGRRITRFWTRVETYGRRVIHDSMCGFRVYPLRAALEVSVRGNAMDFDPEIAVRLAWSGVRVVNVPTRTRYLSAEDGGVSHFRMIRDNALISWMHTRLVVRAIVRGVFPS